MRVLAQPAPIARRTQTARASCRSMSRRKLRTGARERLRLAIAILDGPIPPADFVHVAQCFEQRICPRASLSRIRGRGDIHPPSNEGISAGSRRRRRCRRSRTGPNTASHPAPRPKRQKDCQTRKPASASQSTKARPPRPSRFCQRAETKQDARATLIENGRRAGFTVTSTPPPPPPPPSGRFGRSPHDPAGFRCASAHRDRLVEFTAGTPRPSSR